jgi:hypothetical protein
VSADVDPQLVREIAQDALTIAIRRGRAEAVEAALLARSFVVGNTLSETFDEYAEAVGAEYLRLASEQPTAEQGGDEAADAVREFLDAWEADRGPGSIRGGNADMPYLFSTDLRAVLAERIQLAARVAELEAHPALLLAADAEEREADVRVVMRFKAVDTLDFSEDAFAEWSAACEALYDRFADRIAALEAHDTKAREQR